VVFLIADFKENVDDVKRLISSFLHAPKYAMIAKLMPACIAGRYSNLIEQPTGKSNIALRNAEINM
jgi:hypothetical protein